MSTVTNSPALWRDSLRKPRNNDHKYLRGHAVIYAAPELTGATRLAAESCARVGAGLVSVLCSPETAVIYRESLKPHILVRDDMQWWDERVTARLYGSGGLSVSVDYSRPVPTVLDADALHPDVLGKTGANYILTPHEGEFNRMFSAIGGSRTEKAQEAARTSGSVIVLKGAQTLIAAPGRDLVVNKHASPVLATAGTGDVLAGMITGFVAQGVEPFQAACASVWIHGEAGVRFGAGMVASDIPEMIPEILQEIA